MLRAQKRCYGHIQITPHLKGPQKLTDAATINQSSFMCFPFMSRDIHAARDSVVVNKEFIKRTVSTFISGPPGMFGNFACYSRDKVVPLYWMAPLRLAMASSFAIF